MKFKGIILGGIMSLLLASSALAYQIVAGDTPYGLWGSNWLTELQSQLGISDPTKMPTGVEVSLGEEMLGGTLPVAGQTYYLAGSGITGSATSITLTSLTISQTGYKLQDSDFSSTFYITLEPGSTKRQEISSCTTVTQNANGTATLSGCSRGLLPFTPYTASSTYQFAHAGGTQVIFSDAPQLFNEYPAKSNSETITGQWNFSTYIPYIPTSTPTDDRHAVSLYQFQQATTTGGINGSLTQKGVWEGATRAEMAAGTASGSSGAELVLKAEYATSSPSATTSIPITNSSGKISSGFGGSASSIATLDANTLVVQNPANATSTPTASKIPISSASSTLDNNWLNNKFGGDGTDGALNITSATTTIDLENNNVVIKNYTSINISAGAVLAFSNAASDTGGSAIILKSQGNCTIAGTIQATSTGGAGGAAVSATSGNNTNGLSGKNGSTLLLKTNFGTGGTAPTTPGVAGAAVTTFINNTSTLQALLVYPSAFIGAGGGSGAVNNTNSATVTSGKGGDGAGLLIIQCNGAFNFTGTINLNGQNGGNGTVGTNTWTSGGGGGGAGGTFIGLYNSLTANSGTVNVSGGGAGSQGAGGASDNIGGGGGGADDVGGSPSGGNGGTGDSGEYMIGLNNFIF